MALVFVGLQRGYLIGNSSNSALVARSVSRPPPRRHIPILYLLYFLYFLYFIYLPLLGL